MDDIYKNIEEINPSKKSKILIVFDDVIADMISNKNLNPTIYKLFIRGRGLDISLVYVKHTILLYQKILLHSTHEFVMKIHNKRELQPITFSHSSDIYFKGFMNLEKGVLQNHFFSD